MPKGVNAFDTHDFYCINCGQKGIPITRQRSKRKSTFHRKLMYCWHCKHTVNHIECCNEEERQQFLLDFAAGKYLEEAQESLIHEKEHHSRYQNYLVGLK